jgi:putative membrane protein
MFYGSGWSFWQVAFMWVAMIAFWSLLIWAVYALVIQSSRHESPRSPRGEAPQILAERLARGEIGVEEYQHLRDVLCLDGHAVRASGATRGS